MSPFTIFVIILAAVAAVLGFRKGLIGQVGQILAVVGAIMACRMLAPQVVVWICGSADAPATDTALCYALTFIVAYTVVLLAARVLRGAVGAVHLGLLDRIAGAAFKLCLWMLILSVMLNLWAAVAPASDITDTRRHPERARLMAIAPAVCGYVMQHSQAAKTVFPLAQKP